MLVRYRFVEQTVAMLIVAVCVLLVALLPASALLAAPRQQPPTITLELEAVADARTQGGSPNVNFGSSLHYFMTPNGHYSFVQFDLTVIPANTVIQSAELQFDILLVNGTSNDVEIGRADGVWDEATITWATQPGVTWGGPVQTVDALGVTAWDVTPVVKAWHEDGAPNYGFVAHGNGGDQVVAGSKESSNPPKLVVTFGAPPEDDNPRPDLGDAPDSSNHHGIANTAYPGINGRFPTVWDVPAGQPAGPRHANQTMESILGDHLSRENEADDGPDQDGPNNILDGGADNANNDRGDDGWRNRNVPLNHCEATTLTVRVGKAPNATRSLMYLNVWFDGEHDGDWDGMQRCRTGEQDDENGLDVPAYEWIVQNHAVDMSGIAPGGYVDIDVNSEIVLNDSPDKRHWMRFMLSEERAVSPSGVGLPDGRGPHPDSALSAYRFGETEDVLQRPQPAGEPGTLELQKRVLIESDPVGYAGTVTYEIRLRHVGGTEPIEARIEDELPYPLHVNRRINDAGDIELVGVEGTPGGVSPLLAQLLYNTTDSGAITQMIRWDGTLAPNAEVTLSFDVHVHPLCQQDEQTTDIDNVATARTRDGVELTEVATFTAACPGYTVRDIDIEVSDRVVDVIDPAEVMQNQWQGDVWNRHAVPVILGFFQQDGVSAATANSGASLRFLERIELEPDQRARVDLDLRMESEISDELTLPDDYAPAGKLIFCILAGEDNTCPDAATHPHLVGEAPFSIRVRPNDLGDAPDSTNHFGVAMAAYAGVQANYPTVFDPATGLPEGPRHSHPRPFHLGQRVSREVEADVGPDQDPTNNIEPVANTPNLDWADDGSRLRNLAHCQRAVADAQVFISPQAAAWFAEAQKSAYLNVWIDSDRDGDWADGFTCQDAEGQAHPVVEHILIDYPIDVAALGAGLHNLPNIATQHVAWPVQLAQQPSWIRFTLSERESNKTLQFGTINYGDGRGYDKPFRTGETEDHRLQPAGGPQDGPDLAVNLVGKVQPATPEINVNAADASITEEIDRVDFNFAEIRFKIDYANVGSRTASGALLEFQIPEKLRDMEIKWLRAPNVAQDQITRNPDSISLTLPDLEPGANGTVVLGWAGCLTCTVASSISADEYTAVARARLEGDVDPSNNEDSITLRGLLSSPMVGMLMDYNDDGKIDHLVQGKALTCRTEPRLGGRAEPGMPVEIVIDGTVVATVNANENGRFGLTPAPLSPGDHRILPRYPSQVGAATVDEASFDRGYLTPYLRLRVDPSLPFDPVSLHFTDSQGRVTLPVFNRSGDASLAGLSFDVQLRAGESYSVEVDTCSNNADVKGYRIIVGDQQVVRLADEDGDGHFVGAFTYAPSATADSIRGASIDAAAQSIAFVSIEASTESVVTGEVNQPGSAVVRNRDNGQPLPATSVNVLSAQGGDESISFETWDGAGLGQSNPVQSDTNGSFSINVDPGIYRLDVVADGFQPYRTGDIDVAGSTLATDVTLSPAIGEDAGYTIYVDDSGFAPALITVKPGSVVEWVNVGLDEHAVSGSSHDSGLLGAGESYKAKFVVSGTFAFADGVQPHNVATVVVFDETTLEMARLYLPVIIAR